MYMCGLCGGNMWLLTPLPPGIWNFIPHVWFVIAYTAYTLTSGMICHTTTWSLSGDSSWLWVPRWWTHIHIIHPNHTHIYIYIYMCVCPWNVGFIQGTPSNYLWLISPHILTSQRVLKFWYWFSLKQGTPKSDGLFIIFPYFPTKLQFLGCTRFSDTPI